MVDELIMPGGIKEEVNQKLHSKWTKLYSNWTRDMQTLQSHIKGLDGSILWISCAGQDGEAKHFEKSYLTKLLPEDFHVPEMQIPLRNTKQTLALAKLDQRQNTDAIGLYSSAALSAHTRPIYDIPNHLMEGVKGQEFLVESINNNEEVQSTVKAACEQVLKRTGGAGFPVLCNASTFESGHIEMVLSGMKRLGLTPLIYHHDPPSMPNTRTSYKCCREEAVQMWLRNYELGEERSCLITDQHTSRGWEASHILVIALDRQGLENLVMRAVGFCALVRDSVP